MNKLFTYSTAALGLFGLVLSSCQPELEEPKASAGSADFTRYIAVGNSLTAGFSDGGLYREGQLSSYPNLLAGQFSKAGGGAFVQPLFTESQANGSGYLRLTGFTNPPAPAEPSPTTANVTTNLAYTRMGGSPARPLLTEFLEPVGNLGVPGIRLADVETPGYGSANGNVYFERITPDANANQTYRARVAASNPTFFTYWLGNNDVLGYATSGGVQPTTAVSTFTDLNSRMIDDLTANGAKGLVATIPDVTNIPFFTTVGPTFRRTLTRLSVPQLVITTGSFSVTSPIARRVIATTDIRDATGGTQLFTLTASPYLALFNQRTGRPWRDVYNQVRPGLPAVVTLGLFLASQGIDTTQTFGTSTGNPIPTTLVLDDTEQGVARTATTAFNDAIKAKANAKNLAIFDSNTFFRDVAQGGFTTNVVNNNAGFITGNLFSLDGVHPTPRGYAVIANEMIRAINAKYGATIPFVNANDYRGVLIP